VNYSHVICSWQPLFFGVGFQIVESQGDRYIYLSPWLVIAATTKDQLDWGGLVYIPIHPNQYCTPEPTSLRIFQAEAHRLFEARILAQRLSLVDIRTSSGFWFSSIHFRGQISTLTYRKRNRAGNPVYRYLPLRVKKVSPGPILTVRTHSTCGASKSKSTYAVSRQIKSQLLFCMAKQLARW
jgi:hypothetical protein